MTEGAEKRLEETDEEMSENRLTLKQNMIWFTGGSLFYLVCQWLMTVLVVTLGSYGDGGVLSLSISLTGTFFVVSTFGLRNFHVSDVKGQYSSSLYVSTRVMTCLLGLACCAVFTLLNVQYDLNQKLCIVLYMLFRLTEALVDVLAGEEQKKWRMDYVGKSFVFRGVVSLGSFVAMMAATGSLALSLAVMALLTMAVVFLFDWRVVKRLSGFRFRLTPRESLPLMRQALPLMVNSALLTVLAAVPRYFLEMYAGSDTLGIYAAVATPAVIVQAACNFIYSPLVSPLSEMRAQHDKAGYRRIILLAMAAIGGVLALTVAGAAVLGRWGLNLLFGESILPYAQLLIPVLLTSFCMALIYFFDVPLTIVRRLKTMTLIHACAVALSVILSVALIPSMGMAGVNLVMYLCAGGDAAAMGVVAFLTMRRDV